MSEDSAAQDDLVTKPHDWDKVVSSAYLRLLGASQETAAEAAGASERSLWAWEKCSWWPDAEAEAKRRWLQGLASKARVSVEKGVGTDANLALKILERLDVDLRPPKERHELTGANDGPIEHKDVGDTRRRFASRISGIASRIGANGGHPSTNGSGA